MLDILQDILPSEWFNDVREYYGDTLTDDMITQSVQQASDFFNIEEPMIVAEDWTTGVYPNATVTPMDDVLVFNREQLIEMGITEQEGLNLVMTHEGAHRALQGMDLGFDSHQEELCCDFMAGVRAGLNGIDVSQMEDSLADTEVSLTHPGGAERVDAIEAGVEFAEEYYREHGVAPTFSECLSYFTEEHDSVDFGTETQINLRPEDNEISFKGYTQSEINSRINKAERDMGYWKAEMRRHAELAKHDSIHETEIHHMKMAERKYEAAKAEYNKWKETKPDKEN